MKNMTLSTLLAIATLAGCSSFFEAEQDHTHLKDMMIDPIDSKLMARSGSNVVGDLRFTQKADGVQLDVELKGVDPESTHGFHIHENGDCSSKDAKSAGGHFNPTDHKHGSPEGKMHHLGDLGNVTADKDGMVKKSIMIKGASIEDGQEYSILDRAVILHAEADDYKSQPSGNSGSRIACAVIKKD